MYPPRNAGGTTNFDSNYVAGGCHVPGAGTREDITKRQQAGGIWSQEPLKLHETNTIVLNFYIGMVPKQSDNEEQHHLDHVGQHLSSETELSDHGGNLDLSSSTSVHNIQDK